MGEGLYLLREALTNKERKDPTIAEIANAFDDDAQNAMGLALQRLANDLTMEGGLGLLGDYANIAQSYVTRGGFKNPVQPPGVTMILQLGQLISSRLQRALPWTDSTET